LATHTTFGTQVKNEIKETPYCQLRDDDDDNNNDNNSTLYLGVLTQ
jgi:hypothetical protein